MSAYATVADVQALAGLAFGASTLPRTDQVGGFLTETAAVLDGILSAKGYSLPVATSATSALELLEHFNALGGQAKALAANPAAPKDRRDAAETAWKDAQTMLRDGLIEPVGLTKDTATARVRVGETASAFFTRDMGL